VKADSVSILQNCN